MNEPPGPSYESRYLNERAFWDFMGWLFNTHMQCRTTPVQLMLRSKTPEKGLGGCHAIKSINHVVLD